MTFSITLNYLTFEVKKEVMKYISTVLLLALYVSTHAQDINFEIKNTFSRPVNNEMLNKAKSLMDINPGYPSSWISDYVSTEILVSSNGKTIRALGVNDMLSYEQMDNITSADPGTDINVEVKYKSFNSINNKIEINEMKFAVSLVPQFEAEYPGGKTQLKSYIKENAILKLKDTKILKQALIKFVVNENGEISQVKIAQSSEDKTVDQLLLNTISNMPLWKPAIDKNGKKLKQEFLLTVGNAGC